MKIAPVPTLIIATFLCAAPLAIAVSATMAPDELSPAQRAQTVAAKAKGANVLRAQVLLDRAHFSSGEIDAAYGDNLRKAILGFQKMKGLGASGVVDAPTWAALETDTAPVLTSYTITEEDAGGPFERVPTEMADKAKLSALGFENPAEALGEKFHASPALLKTLNFGKDFGHAGEQIVVPNVAAATTLPKASKIVVDRSDGTLTLLDASDKAIAQFPATTGSVHDPLPVGDWKVQGIAHHPVFNYNPSLFWDAHPGDAKAKIPAGPNNPVGVVWIDLSKEHYGIHGTPEPSTIGKTQSHGCIRLTNWDATLVAQAVQAGVAVVLQE